MTTDANGNVYTASWVNWTASDIGWLVSKYAADGSWQWVKGFNAATGADLPVAIAASNGYVYVTGTTKGTYNKVYTVRLDASGNISGTWPQTYDGGVRTDPVGITVSSQYVYIAGTIFQSSANNYANYFVIRYPLAGGAYTVMSPHYNFGTGSATQDTAIAMTMDSYENIFVVGCSKSGTNVDAAILKVTGPTLAASWGKTWDGGNGRDFASSVYVSNTNSIYVGTTWKDVTDFSVAMLKYYQDGTRPWVKKTQIGVGGSLRTVGMAMDRNSSPPSIYAAGNVDIGFDKDFDITAKGTIVKYDSTSTGNEIWKNISSAGTNYWGVVLDNSANVWVGGTTLGNSYDFAIREFSSSGTQLTTLTYDPLYGPGVGSPGNDDYAYCMTVDVSSGSIFVGGALNPTMDCSVGDDYSVAFNTYVCKFSTGTTLLAPRASYIVPPEDETPQSFGLRQNYPNPFNPSTTIEYQVPVGDNITIKVYDVLGKEVQTLVDDQFTAPGSYRFTFNSGKLASGSYFYRLTSKNSRFQEVKKMMIIK